MKLPPENPARFSTDKASSTQKLCQQNGLSISCMLNRIAKTRASRPDRNADGWERKDQIEMAQRTGGLAYYTCGGSLASAVQKLQANKAALAVFC